MGQTNLIRTEFTPCELLTSSVDAFTQNLAFTSYFKVGDSVDIVAKDAKGCYVGSALATGLTVCGIVECESLAFDASVDTSTALPTGAVGWYAVAKNIDDGQEAIDRLYRCFTKTTTEGNIQLCQDIVDSTSGAPLGGQTTLFVNDISCFRPSDEVQVICDSGVVVTTTIVSLDANADEANNLSEIVISSEVDLSGETNCQVCTTKLSIFDMFLRLKENIDMIDKPCENEYMGTGDCDMSTFEANNLFLAGTSKLFLDGRRLRLGTAGTRAEHSYGAGNAELRFVSLPVGTQGDTVAVEVTSDAGLTVTTTGCLEDGDKKITISNDGGTATAEEIADAVNSDADARKWLQVIYGGGGATADGSGTPGVLAETELSGGLNDGSGDYAEIPPVINNEITLTGYKWVSLWILPDDRNRLNTVPRDSEELTIDYRKALTNA
jgi:hypothetical protein